MAQQLNLNDPRFTPQRLRLGARQTLWAMAGLAVLSFGVGQAMVWQAGRASADAAAVQATLAPLRSALLSQGAAAPAAAASAGSAQTAAGAEITRLQQIDMAQRRILAALDQGLGAAPSGSGLADTAGLPAAQSHAGYLQALARQASTQLWLTGFSVSEDGRDIDLEGRMSDAKALPDYLRRLNDEPRFKGRPFAQLSLKAVDAEASTGVLPYTAFSLRSSATAGTSAGTSAVTNTTVKP